MIVTQMIQKIYVRKFAEVKPEGPFAGLGKDLKYEASPWGEVTLHYGDGKKQTFLYVTGKMAEAQRKMLEADGWRLEC